MGTKHLTNEIMYISVLCLNGGVRFNVSLIAISYWVSWNTTPSGKVSGAGVTHPHHLWRCPCMYTGVPHPLTSVCHTQMQCTGVPHPHALVLPHPLKPVCHTQMQCTGVPHPHALVCHTHLNQCATPTYTSAVNPHLSHFYRRFSILEVYEGLSGFCIYIYIS